MNNTGQLAKVTYPIEEFLHGGGNADVSRGAINLSRTAALTEFSQGRN
jgi:hypothetical protein